MISTLTMEHTNLGLEDMTMVDIFEKRLGRKVRVGGKSRSNRGCSGVERSP
jgi:hypothetical protein